MGISIKRVLARYFLLTLLLVPTLFLTACPGAIETAAVYAANKDDDDDDDNDSSGGGTASGSSQTGVLIDSPVINIGYRTATKQGVTNAQGEYEFLPGETVVFFIGDLEFPPVEAKGVVTPLDIAGTENTSDNQVINMIRLLQTLDKDGNPDNGITLSDAAKSAATQIDLDQPVTDFENDPAVQSLIANGGQDSATTELVSEEDASNHFESELADNNVEVGITGGWLAQNDENNILLFLFMNNGTYLHAEVDLNDPNEISGMEYGKYERNQETGKLTVSIIKDMNGDTGLTDFAVDPSLSVFVNRSDNILTLTVDENGDGAVDPGQLDFARIDSDDLIGGWSLHEANGSVLMFVFMSDGTYVEADYDAVTGEDSGMEWGDITRDPDTGRITSVSQRFDQNGEAGLTDFNSGPGVAFFNPEGHILNITIDEDGDGVFEETLEMKRQ